MVECRNRSTCPRSTTPAPSRRGLYRTWMERGAFTPVPAPGREPYVIVIPPPNVTGVLHMGHGLNNTIQDVLIRFERARGRETLWLPGTDHAGIATQNVVERLIAKEGKTRFDLGREAFVERVWQFVRTTGSTILEQLKQIGASCDWSRTRFTLDPAYTRAVREVFVRLWEEGLIYRGHRVIHWCPRCLTALSDEEAEFRETTGALYYIHYPLTDGVGTRHRRDDAPRDAAGRHCHRRCTPTTRAARPSSASGCGCRSPGGSRSRCSPTRASTRNSAPAS